MQRKRDGNWGASTGLTRTPRLRCIPGEAGHRKCNANVVVRGGSGGGGEAAAGDDDDGAVDGVDVDGHAHVEHLAEPLRGQHLGG